MTNFRFLIPKPQPHCNPVTQDYETELRIYAIILKTRYNPVTQDYETKLRKNKKFIKTTSVWVYNFNRCITKIGYDADYYGKTDIYVINNKTDYNNLWSFCERLQKKNPGWFVHLGILPSVTEACHFCGKCKHKPKPNGNILTIIEGDSLI